MALAGCSAELEPKDADQWRLDVTCVGVDGGAPGSCTSSTSYGDTGDSDTAGSSTSSGTGGPTSSGGTDDSGTAGSGTWGTGAGDWSGSGSTTSEVSGGSGGSDTGGWSTGSGGAEGSGGSGGTDGSGGTGGTGGSGGSDSWSGTGTGGGEADSGTGGFDSGESDTGGYDTGGTGTGGSDSGDWSGSGDDDGGGTTGSGGDDGPPSTTDGTTYCGSVKMSEDCTNAVSGKVSVGVSVPGIVTTGVTHEVTSSGTAITSSSCSVCGSSLPGSAEVLCENDHEYEFASDTPCKVETVLRTCYKTSNGFTFNADFALPPGSSVSVTGSTATKICLEGTGSALRTFEQACQFGEFAEWCSDQTPITTQIAQNNLDAIIAAHGVTGPADFCLDDRGCGKNGIGMKWRCVNNRCLIRSELGETCTPADEPRNNFRPWCREDEDLTCECRGWGPWRECECVED